MLLVGGIRDASQRTSELGLKALVLQSWGWEGHAWWRLVLPLSFWSLMKPFHISLKNCRAEHRELWVLGQLTRDYVEMF